MNARQHLALHSGPLPTMKSLTKIWKVKALELNGEVKGHLLIVSELKQDSRVILFDLNKKCVHWSRLLCVCVCVMHVYVFICICEAMCACGGHALISGIFLDCLVFLEFVLCMCVGTLVPWCTCGSQRTALGTQFSPASRLSLEDQTQIPRLGGEHIYLLGNQFGSNLFLWNSISHQTWSSLLQKG